MQEIGADQSRADVDKAEVATTIREARARAHDLAPAHVRGIEMETVDPDKEVSIQIPRARAAVRGTSPDLGEFGVTMHNALKDVVAGYILHVRQNGTLVYIAVWNWAQTPADDAFGWTENTRIHVASVSKLLTAIGMVKLLKSKNVSLDAKIIDYLPGYWSKGSNVSQISFRHLLTHTSGFVVQGSATDFPTMKTAVAMGVAGVGMYNYENVNFALCRILMSVINGDISKDATFVVNDAFWDISTVNAYRKYMQANVFTPAGVTSAGFAPPPNGALAYAMPYNAVNIDGWNSGDLYAVSGGAGWRLSIKELLNVLDHARRRNTILPAATTQSLLDNRLGIDQVISTPAGNLYNKNGAWGPGSGEMEQAVAYFWPNGMEMAVFVNSPIGTNKASLRKLVSDAFVSSL